MICDLSTLELKTRLSQFLRLTLVKMNPSELGIGCIQKMEHSLNKRTQNFENEPQSAGDSLLYTPNSFKRPRTPSNSEPPTLTLQSGGNHSSVDLGWTIDATISTRGQSKAQEYPRDTRSPVYPVEPSTESSYHADNTVMNNAAAERSEEPLPTMNSTAAEILSGPKNDRGSGIITDVARRCFGMVSAEATQCLG